MHHASGQAPIPRAVVLPYWQDGVVPAVVARLGPSLTNAVVALGIVGTPSFFRLTRGSALSARQAAYVEAARAVGATDRRILLRHILPNINPSLVLLATMRLGVLVLAGGELSFIGLGAQPPQPE